MNNQIENQVEVQPKNQKSGKGKTFAIVILVLLVLGLGGFIAYREYTNNNEIDKLSGKIEDLEKQIQNTNTNTSVVENQKTNQNNILGYYKTGKLSTPMPTCESGSLEQTTEFHLLENGTFTYQYQSTCDSADQTGSYTYNTNKLTLTCDPNNSAQCDGSPTEYTINENGTLTINNGADNPAVFNKVTENELQVLKK